MKLSLASLKVHLAHCCASRQAHRIGLAFTATGTPTIVPVPGQH